MEARRVPVGGDRRMIKSYGILAMIAAALVAGCGGSSAEGASGPQAQIGGPSGTELAERQVVHVGNGAELQTLDPHHAEDTASFNVQMDLYEGLVSEAADGELVPGVAADWTVSEDGKTYVFNLRREARWSNGDPVTAHDFVFSFRRGVDPKTLSVYSYILTPLLNADEITAGKRKPEDLGVRALDDHTLEIKLANPTPYFLGLLAHSMSSPVHRATLETHGDQWTRPGNLVGNGAFKLDEWVVQSHVKVVRNPHYWDNANTKLEEVWFHAIEDQNAEMQRFRALELDMTEIIPAAQIGFIRENLADELVVAPYLGSYYYGFNVTRPPFKDKPKLRRALSLAVNRDVITKQVLNVGQISSYGFVPPIAGYTQQQMIEASWTQEQREAEAKRLYAEAGYGPDNPLRTQIMYNTQEDHRRIAVAIQQMWKQVLGVEAEILNQEWKVFLDTRNQRRDTQVYRQGWIGDYNDPFTYLELLRSTAGQNDSGYSNPEYDKLVTASQSALDPQARMELLQQAERLMLTEMPIMPLYIYVRPRLIQPWIRGYESNIMDHHRHKYMYVLKH
jgi:oligopeptide transport system substrate-binding protein